jgi:hypothetical protein
MPHGVLATLKPDVPQTRVIDLQKQFERSLYWPLRQLICQIEQDRVVLRGTVPCYYLKQLAQTLAIKSMGVGSISSDIEVRPA